MAVRKKYDRNVLGRGLDNIGGNKGLGLDALIDTHDVQTQGSSNLSEIPISMIEANPNQPRREFDEVALQELVRHQVANTRLLPANAVGVPHRWQD